ncbi:MAG: hypothetical protein R6U67_00130 [Sodalinema sp.]|uniref:hypothetical protein n=1 Tax=Sodalinema sp. TaxID=3080550 RepID=UPI001222EC37|nr:MAG: hypothetical protein EYR95_10965 [Phormidium sp. SL48-SHIP]
MTTPSPITVEFLQPEEAAKVDAALLSSQEKFLTRLAIYALRSLQQISQRTNTPADEITPQQVADWIQDDRTIQDQVDVDASFATFFSNLVVASQKPLVQICQETEQPLADITVEQIIDWFERESKRGLDPGLKS